MVKPIPNLMVVKGCRVQCEYKGVKRVCPRCGREGHHDGDNRTTWCHRCLDYGHGGAGCTASCRRCGGRHATSDCLRSYAVTAPGEFPKLIPAGGAGKPADPEQEPESSDALVIDETKTPSDESTDDGEEAVSSGRPCPYAELPTPTQSAPRRATMSSARLPGVVYSAI